VIPQSSIDLIRYETHAVHVRLAERLRDSVQLPRDAHHVNVGGRAYLRFDHGRAPLASQ
jgi:hypothetical protein